MQIREEQAKANTATPQKRRSGQRLDGEEKKAAQATFLDVFGKTANVTLACQAAGVDRSTAYKWKNGKNNGGFGAAWGAALETANDYLEAEAYRRAVQGVEKPVYQGGKQVGSIREYSDLLLIFMMKARMPHKYRETKRLEHTGPEGERVPLATLDEIRRLAEEADGED